MVKGGSDPDVCLEVLNSGHNLGCFHSSQRIPVVIDLRSIRLRLKAYSLRYDLCGMSGWNLEGSEDGLEWTVLHEVRGDSHLMPLLDVDGEVMSTLILVVINNPEYSESEKAEILLGYVEQNHRHTWEIESDAFYQYFRLIGRGPCKNEDDLLSRCMHAVGLELYGDVHEQ